MHMHVSLTLVTPVEDEKYNGAENNEKNSENNDHDDH